MVAYADYNREQRSFYATVVSLDDPLKQGRVQVCWPEIQNAPRSSWPWVKVPSNNSQVTSQSDSTMNSFHSYRMGDNLMINRPTASGQDYTAGTGGHPGTTQMAMNGGTTSDANYYYSGSKYVKQGKVKSKGTTYAADGTGSYMSPPTPPSFMGQYKHVRDHAYQALQNSDFAQVAQNFMSKAQHIGQQKDMNKITKLIQQADPQGMAEATQNLNTAKMLDKLRDSMNQIPDLNGMLGMMNQGQMKGLQDLMGGQGMQFFQQFISMATQAGQNMNNHNSNPNTVNQPYNTIFGVDQNGNVTQSGKSAVAGAITFPPTVAT